MKRDAIAIKTDDNVATAIHDLKAGRTALVGIGEETVRIVLNEDIAYGHKLALLEIEAGGDILKYGAVIGKASRRIEKGTHVHVHNVESLRGRGDLPPKQAGEDQFPEGNL